MRVPMVIMLGLLSSASVSYGQSDWNELPLAAGVFLEVAGFYELLPQ